MHEILLPKLGQSVEDAQIVQWLKKEGDAVQEGEPIFTVQTDKAEIECESTASGILRKILVEPGIDVPVMTVVALVGTADETLPDLSTYGVAGGAPAAAAPTPVPETTPTPAPVPQASAALESTGFASPRARKAAEEKGVDVSKITGTGVGGRITEEDVLTYAASVGEVKITPTARRMAENAGMDVRGIEGTGAGGKITKEDVSRAATTGKAPAPAKAPVPAPVGGVTRVPLTPMRRIIATRMSESKYAAPHYYITIEIDMQKAKDFRAGIKTYKLTYNDLVLCAVVRALKEFPAVNARWVGDAIEQVADINLGVAVALPSGLIVPVIKQAQLLSLEGISAAAKTLATKAQTGKLLPDDYVGNTFTVSNLGAYGVESFTAIINQPDSAIIAVGQMKDRVVAIDGGIHIRPIMKLTISSDHRVIDGSVAAQFMGRVKEIMEAAEF
ncbi:MAG TPA: 2-oxo acid dehydrogenase subunit E2 [Candidatus Hydrogenedentes bacterium]|nr:2-oxo acid dehydrogenase subunit E2 [Candidatus Hydrogenedentota bacterium]